MQTEIFENLVQLNSKVKVKYLNNGKDLKIQLVDKEIRSPEKANGIQKIYVKSPLAVSIFGKAVGETTKVGNLDNYVEILEL